MHISTGTHYPFINNNIEKPGATGGVRGDFARMLSEKAEASGNTSNGTGNAAPDFSNMSRKELFNWMNEQLRSGKMTFEESSPFLGMTMKISVATGEPVDMETDTTRVNFVAKARAGLEGAIWRNDHKAAASLQAAIDTMLAVRG